VGKIISSVASAAMLCAIALTVQAADVAPKADMTKPILDNKGQPIKDAFEATPNDPTCKMCPILTIGAAISHALSANFADEASLSGDQKWARSLLGNRLRDETDAHLTAKEVAVIEKVVGKAFGGQIIAQIVPLIDPNHKEPEVE
jgi:hypothetical protein